MQCRDFQEIADSYLGDELSVETNHEVIRHVGACDDCRRELAARRELRARLRSAFVKAAEMQPGAEFVEQLRTRLRASAEGGASAWAGGRAWLAVAACLLLSATIVFVAVRRQLLPDMLRDQTLTAVAADDARTKGARQVGPEHPAAAPATVSATMTTMTKTAAGDHRDCAVKFRLAETPIDMEEAARKFDRAYLNLASAAMEQHGELTGQIEFVEAHSCVTEGRRFGHVVLRHRGHLVSLLITEPARPEVSTAEARQPPPADSLARVIACSQAERYQVSCFETPRHAVFVVSDLSEADNLSIARALAPSVFEHLVRAEGVA